MALNFSHRPENLVSPMRIENCFDYGRERVERDGSPESVSKDIIDLLPSDPFGMDITTTFTAITGWLEDLEVDYGGYGRSSVGGTNEYSLFAGLNFIWNNAFRFQSFPGTVLFDDKFSNAFAIDPYAEARELAQLGVFESVSNVKDIAGFNRGSSRGVAQNIEETPHEAFLYALSYLGTRDLLSIESVCKSLRSTVRSDPLLWQSIHIGQPLNEKITDDVLLQLTSRAQGNLHCLSLVQCPWITDDSLKRVLDANPRLTKLCVPGCTRLSIEGVMNSLRAFQSNKATPGIKHLRVGGLYGVTREHFEELKSLLGTDIHSTPQNGNKPHFYLEGNLYLLCDDERAIDIEMCPRCERLRLLYDCPSEGCQANDHTAQVCRACTLCISRCVHCGRCINDSEYVETFFLDFLCWDCSKKQEGTSVGFTENSANQEMGNNSCHHG